MCFQKLHFSPCEAITLIAAPMCLSLGIARCDDKSETLVIMGILFIRVLLKGFMLYYIVALQVDHYE